MDKFTNYNGNDESETTDFESLEYQAPNYDGVRLMDVSDYQYSNAQYGDATYDSAQYNDTQYDGTQYDNTQYESSTYDNVQFDNTQYENTTYDGVQYQNSTYNDTQYNTTYDDIPQEPSKATQTDLGDDSIFSPLYPEGYAPTPNPDDVFRANPQPVRYDENDLTEAELADIKRQKAAARRKKMAARERRRRQRRKQAIIRCSILLAIVILLIVGLVMLISGIANHFEEKKKERELSEYYATSEVTTEEPVADIDPEITAKSLPVDRDAALVILQQQAEDDSTMQSICDSAAAIPDILLQNLAVNSEMKDFTLNYPAKINIVFDGEFSVELEGNDVPLYLQFDERWGYADYSEDIVGLRGAGPTALSMAYTYLKQDGSKNPIKVADYATEMGYLDENGKTHWSLMTDGAEGLGLKSTEMDINKEDMIDALEDGQVLICMVSDGDFTTEEHFIVIRDYKNGFFYINDPMSKARSEVGWDFKRLRGQIDKMCALEAGAEESSSEAGQEGDTTTGEGTGEGGSEGDNGSSGNEDTTPAE